MEAQQSYGRMVDHGVTPEIVKKHSPYCPQMHNDNAERGTKRPIRDFKDVKDVIRVRQIPKPISTSSSSRQGGCAHARSIDERISRPSRPSRPHCRRRPLPRRPCRSRKKICPADRHLIGHVPVENLRSRRGASMWFIRRLPAAPLRRQMPLEISHFRHVGWRLAGVSAQHAGDTQVQYIVIACNYC